MPGELSETSYQSSGASNDRSVQSGQRNVLLAGQSSTRALIYLLLLRNVYFLHIGKP